MSAVSIVQDHPHLSLPARRLRHLVESVAADERTQLLDVNVVLTNHDVVLEMNRQYLDHDFHTDVLAFDLSESEEAGIEGEVYVDLDTARERCVEFASTFEDEAARYVVHGLLHLLGYRDETNDGAAEMKRLEDRYLERYWSV